MSILSSFLLVSKDSWGWELTLSGGYVLNGFLEKLTVLRPSILTGKAGPGNGPTKPHG